MIEITKGDNMLHLSMFPDIEWLLAIMAKLFAIWGAQTPGETVQGHVECVSAIMRHGRHNMTTDVRDQIMKLVCICLN